MNKQICTLVILLIGFSCQSPAEEQNQETKNQPAQTDDITEKTPQIILDSTALFPFIPEGYELLGYRYGDLNSDDMKTDALLALKSTDEEEAVDENGEALKRPLIILIRQDDHSLKQVMSNDEVILCYDCGGVLGDPFQDLVIKDGYFSVEHHGGSAWRWLNIITFKYDVEEKTWNLHKTGMETYNINQPELKEEEILTTKDFGKVDFADFNKS